MEIPNPDAVGTGLPRHLSRPHGLWWDGKRSQHSTSELKVHPEDQDAPQVPPESPALYSHKRAADDLTELARQLGATQIFVGGHDW